MAIGAPKSRPTTKAPAPPPSLFLHCKCNACATWGIKFDQSRGIYLLVCTTCHEEIMVGFDLLIPVARLHWEKEE